MKSADDLDLKPGRKVLALVKSSFIRLYSPEHAPKQRPQLFPRRGGDRIDAERNSEIRLDIGFGKTLHAVVPRETAEDLGLDRPPRPWRLNPSQVILAVN